MKTRGRHRAWLAWAVSLLVHGLLLAALLWWLGAVTKPAELVARVVPMSLAMLVEPAAKPMPPAEPVAIAEPVAEPVAAAVPAKVESIPEPMTAQVLTKPRPLAQPKPTLKPPPPKPQVEKPRVKHEATRPTLPAPSEPIAAATPAPAAPVEMQATPVLAPVVPAPIAADAQADAEAAYKARVRQAVAEHKHYPKLARRMQEEGRVVVEFTLESSGALVAVRIKQGSGSELLDEAALQAVRDAAPFAPFPEGSTRQRWEFTLPLSFMLDA